MKNKKIKDERVLQLNNKILSEAYCIVLFLTIVSLFIKSYVMDMSFLQYVVELSIIFLSIAYIAVRSMLIGYDFMNNYKRGKTNINSTDYYYYKPSYKYYKRNKKLFSIW
jgi:hypothetical protein